MAARQETKAVEDSQLDWLQRDRHVIEGLDHLGIEVVSVGLYALLVPGITNVTDRVRYHTFYPWVLDQFAQGKARGRREWRDWIRSLDFALALSSAAHERDAEQSDNAVVGAFTARRLLRDVRNESQVLDFRHLVEVDEKGQVPAGAYFKNAEGGWGQYYKGAGDDLGLTIEETKSIDPDRILTTYAGLPAARCAHEIFRQLLEIANSRRGGLRDLAKIGASVSPSAIIEDTLEEKVLRQLILEGETDLSKGQNPRSRLWRRKSLLLILHYAAACEECGMIIEPQAMPNEFRWSCLAGHLPNGTRWKVPDVLYDVSLAWGSYQRNDVMNFVLEVLHWALLVCLNEGRMQPEHLAREMASIACDAIHADQARGPMSAARGSVDKWLTICTRSESETVAEAWGEGSTWAWFEAMRDAQANGENQEATKWAVRLLGRLAVDRGPNKDNPFESLPGAAEMVAAHDVHYGRWLTRTKERAQEPVAAFLSDLILDWVIFRHLRVATRKLASQGVSTFKFRPEEGELLALADPPEPTLTNPRLRQAFRFLEDLHYLRRGKHGLEVTPAGIALLRGSR